MQTNNGMLVVYLFFLAEPRFEISSEGLLWVGGHYDRFRLLTLINITNIVLLDT